MVAVLPEGAPEPTVVKRLPNDAARLKRWLAPRGRGRFGPGGAARDVLERALAELGPARSLADPPAAGGPRKHDRKDAGAGAAPTIRVPIGGGGYEAGYRDGTGSRRTRRWCWRLDFRRFESPGKLMAYVGW